MAQVSKYRYLLNQYPETVQKEQFRIICHISKRTARYLLQSGLVPCVQSGKKTRNYTIKLTVHYVCPELQEFFDELKKYPAISGERTIPYFIFHGGDIAKLAYATNEFLYYEDSNYMPLMFRTVDGTLVSDNEFADMGLYESEENVENGTEHILPFTDYGSDAESACDLEDEEDLEI